MAVWKILQRPRSAGARCCQSPLIDLLPKVWQWIRHRAALEEGGFVTTNLVRKLVVEVVTELGGLKEVTKLVLMLIFSRQVRKAGTLLMEVVTCRNFPEFLTTLLSENHEFRKRHYPQGFWDEA